MPLRSNIALHLLLALLALSPLHYYTCNSDKRDERFAWRMFSPTRIEKCSFQFYSGASRSPLSVGKDFHPAWMGLGRRARKQVLEGMAKHLCEKEDRSEIYLSLQCEKRPRAIARAAHSNKRIQSLKVPRDADDDEVEVIVRPAFNLCQIGEL